MTVAPTIHRHVDAGVTCCDPLWEEAYRRFETPEQEISKFQSRLKKFGITDDHPTDARLAELFCGRGGGLIALADLGFTNLTGVDLSLTLLEQYWGADRKEPAELHLADCRSLPFADASLDAVIIQGGLHHLPNLPADLESTLSEVRRVLSPSGHLYVVEPWLTPFLAFVHKVVANRWVRRCWDKGDALAQMIDHERETYEQWLDMPDKLMPVFHEHFVVDQQITSWGKLQFKGRPRSSPNPNQGPRH
ncbi:hypothetical protein K227x_10590 [Rubripirellula lacrimiformis]|uniref:Methyltransferase type 11 domain-containing protein n=1 Tax=Rubripirellula lacrimiformis TaxID=1930273 RepID=A0A517N6D3_9BACT|nr:class I SAM-dependent methyltransferase [Rubripirellula lacrimiformis]QDT02681.1 hypothetical protein K227x_10590 [Rubripirellula lacrimiformis]